MRSRRTKIEMKGLVRKYIMLGLTQAEIGDLLGMSRQAIHYWMNLVRTDERKHLAESCVKIKGIIKQWAEVFR